MSDQKSPVTLTQIAASALAASSAAFAASYLGVTGTIIGAAVASVIATVASAMYGASLDRSTAAVRRTATQLVRPPERRVAPAPVAVPEEADLAETRVLVIAPEPPRVTPVRRDAPTAWTRTALAAAVVLGITLASLTGLEAVVGKPLSAFLGGSDADGTSLGSAVSRDAAGTGSAPEPTRTTPESPATEPAATPTAEPTAEPTPEPTPVPTEGPVTDPETDPGTDPVTPSPTPTTPADPVG